MKILAVVLMTVWMGTCAFAQAPATETKPAAADSPALAPATPPASSPKTASAPAESSSSGANSIEYVGADIQDVLRTLARQAGLNLVMGEDVTGKVTISLVDEKAIKLIAD